MNSSTRTRKKRLPRWLRILIMIFTSGLAAGLIYAWLAYDYYQTPPVPIVDAYAVLNARNDAYSEDEKAWTVYFDIRYNHWWIATETLNDKIYAFQKAEKERTYTDIMYEPEDPFTSSHNMFGVPPTHPFYADVVQITEHLQPQIARAREAAARPVFGTPITNNIQESMEFSPDWFAAPPTADLLDRDPLLDFYMPWVGTSKAVAAILALDAQVAADSGDTERAAADIRAMLGMARQAAGDPMLVAQLIACSIQSMALERLHEIIARQPPGADMTPILDLVSVLRARRDKPIAIRIEDEQLSLLDWLGFYYSDDGSGDGHLTVRGIQTSQDIPHSDTASSILISLAWPLKDRFMSKREALDHLQTGIDAFQSLQTQGPTGLPAFIDAEAAIFAAESTGKQSLIPLGISTPAWKKALFTEAFAQSWIEATLALLAIERHRLDTGSYPETLADLSPTYLDAIPQDPFDPGQPLKYRLIDNTPHLYSVGSDGDDDRAQRLPEYSHERASDYELRFADPAGPSPSAPDADWVIYPPRPDAQ